MKHEASYLTVDYYRKEYYPVEMLCSVLGIARSSYYKHKGRNKPEKEKQDEHLCTLILEYHKVYDGILGYRRMTMFINHFNQTNYSVGYIHRLMKLLRISARIRRKKVNRKTVKPDYIKENILARDFTTTSPNEKWLADITEFSMPGQNRKLYLSSIMDLYDNSIIEYELSHSNNNQLVFKMFDRAVLKHPGAKPIFHSDRGFQYTNSVFKKKVDNAEMTQSMSRVGKCIDNGPMEGFFGMLKTEMFYGKRFDSMEDLISSIQKYIKFYNEEQLQKRLKCLAPMGYRSQALAV